MPSRLSKSRVPISQKLAAFVTRHNKPCCYGCGAILQCSVLEAPGFLFLATFEVYPGSDDWQLAVVGSQNNFLPACTCKASLYCEEHRKASIHLALISCLKILQKKKHHQLQIVLCGRCVLLSQGVIILAVSDNGGYGEGKGFVNDMLSYQRDPIPTSLLQLNSDSMSRAVKLFQGLALTMIK